MPVPAITIVSNRPALPSGYTSPKPMVVIVMNVMNSASSNVAPCSAQMRR